ncbi:uncharacterized protein TNCV_1421501 [Trichonephila clavipes]|nr:uncharacterized protein TNCV_1421501 [Trichonephila clavipes]
MAFSRRPDSRHPRQTSRREDHNIVRNARVKLTASSAAIQAQVEPSLGAPVSPRNKRSAWLKGIWGRGAPYVCCR